MRKEKCFVVGSVFLLLLFLMLAIGTAEAKHEITVNLVKDGGFEEGWYGDVPYWTGGSPYNWHIVNYNPHFGEQHLQGNGNYGSQVLSQEIDFTYLDTIGLYWWFNPHFGENENRRVGVKIDNALYWSDYIHHDDYKYAEIDVSGVEGVKALRLYADTNARPCVDDVRGVVTVDLEEIRNPSFEKPFGVKSNPRVHWQSWADVDVQSGVHSEAAVQSADELYHGLQVLKLVAEVDGVGTTSAGVVQKIDLSSSTPYLNFRMWCEEGVRDASIVVAVDGFPVWQYAGEALWQEFSAPLTGYYGTSEVSIYATASSDSSITAYIDDVAFGEEKATISGYTYDAGAGVPLPDVAVRMDSVWGSSNNLGFYSINAPLGIHIITATKPDYYDAVLPITVTHTGDYEMDIALIPKPTSYIKPSILGIVQTLPNYQPAKTQVVKIENETWRENTITNDFGYYAFHNLDAGGYQVDVSKRGYLPSSHPITIVDTTVLHNIDLEPTEWNIIEIIIEKIMEWWWLLLLLIVLMVGFLLLRGRKGYIQHPKKEKR